MKIGYIETFPLLGKDRWQKIPLETETDVNIPLDATDEEIEEIMVKVRRIQYALRKQVQSFFYESNAAAEKQMGIKENYVTPDPYGSGQFYPVNTTTTPRTSEQEIIQDIGSCKDIKTLDVYRLIAKSNPDIKEAYDKKLLELQKSS